MTETRLLRLSSGCDLISAQVFEEIFTKHLDQFVDVRTGKLSAFLDEVLGPPGCSESGNVDCASFRAATTGVDMLSVDHEGLIALPRLARLRNRAAAAVRVLVIAHSPAASPLDWALLRPLLRNGDRIVAPTQSARSVITRLCPDLAPYVRVTPHPVDMSMPLQAPEQRILVLSRLVPGKAVHRVIDAHAQLRRRGHRFTLDIAGPLTGPGGTEATKYSRALQARVVRLGTADHVRFLGKVTGVTKAELLTSSRLLVNLSVSLEESFGKSVVEALVHGVPVVVTAWDGLPEVAGLGGVAVPVEERVYGMDVSPNFVTNAVEELLEQMPDSAMCQEAARPFHPHVVGARYQEIFEEALDEIAGCGLVSDDGPDDDAPAAPPAGMLATAAPLNAYSWADLYQAVVEESDQRRRGRSGAVQPLTEGGNVRTRLFYALRRPLERLFAGREPEDAIRARGTSRCTRAGGHFLDRIDAAVADSAASPSSRVVCLDLLWSEGWSEAVRRGLTLLRSDGATSPGMQYLATELLAHDGHVAEALDYCLASDDPGFWDEHAADRLRQLARLAVEADLPERALPRLRAWTECFPDEPGSGEVWFSQAICAAVAGLGREAVTCLSHARDLLGLDSRVLAATGLLTVSSQRA